MRSHCQRMRPLLNAVALSKPDVTAFQPKAQKSVPNQGLDLCHETSSHLLPSATSFVRAEESYRRGIQTLVEPTKQAVGNLGKHEASSLNASSNTGNVVSSTVGDSNSAVTFTAKSDLKISPRHDTCMIFTCKVCDTRSVKTVSRESYEKGVVVARCGGCNNLHLIADHLGMFGERGSIEDVLAARGEEVRKGTMDTLNLTLEDLAGTNIN